MRGDAQWSLSRWVFIRCARHRMAYHTKVAGMAIDKALIGFSRPSLSRSQARMPIKRQAPSASGNRVGRTGGDFNFVQPR